MLPDNRASEAQLEGPRWRPLKRNDAVTNKHVVRQPVPPYYRGAA